MRCLGPGLAALFAYALVLSPAAAAGPDYVPSPRQAFEGFVAINAPRQEVPVGALWINRYGPVGEPASADNLETVRSLNGVTIDKGLQLSLTAGLFSLLGIEPRFRDRYTARFTDLTIVRVKDVSKLAGPAGEPRIVEAIKAASIIVSAEGELGLNGRTIGWQQRDIEGSTANARVRNHAIEGRDLFIAVRVATPKLIAGHERKLEVVRKDTGEASARIGDYQIAIESAGCAPTQESVCRPTSYAVTKINSYSASASAEQIPAAAGDAETTLALPVPTADGDGGLFDTVLVRWVDACAVRKAEHCRKEPILIGRFSGTSLENLKSPEARGW